MRFVLRVECVMGWFGCPAVGVMKSHLSRLCSQIYSMQKESIWCSVAGYLCPGLAVKPETAGGSLEYTVRMLTGGVYQRQWEVNVFRRVNPMNQSQPCCSKTTLRKLCDNLVLPHFSQPLHIIHSSSSLQKPHLEHTH